MSDTNEPPHPDGPADEPAPPPPPFSESPPPPPPSSTPPPPPAGDNPYGAPAGDGGYGAPPPADGGGYGAPPPENPYAGQPGQPNEYQATDAVGYGWRKFTASPSTLLVPALVAFVGIVITELLVYFLLYNTLLSTHDCTKTVGGVPFTAQCGPSTITRLLVSGLAFALVFVVYQLLVAGLYRGALRVTDGQEFGIGQLFEGYDKGQVVIAAVLIGIGVGIGTALCYLPGLIVSFLTSYTLLFIVDKQMGAVDAIKASYELVTQNLGHTLIYWLLASLITLVGACLCGLGLLVAIPVALVGYAYTYRRLQNQPVVP